MTKTYAITYVPHAEPNSVVTELLPARSEQQALQQIIPKGIPVSVKVSNRGQRTTVSRDYLQQLLTAVLFHSTSGMSAGRALEEIIKAESGALRAQLNPGLYVLTGGGSFSDAVAALEMYDEATIAILRSGETIGAMEQALKSAIEHHEKAATNKKLLYGVLFGLSIDIFFSVISVYGIQFQYLPMVEKQGISGATPEVAAKFHEHLNIAYWINGGLTAITTLVILFICWLFVAYHQKNSHQLRLKVDNWLSTVPVVRDLFSHAAISRTFLMCSTLLRGGVPIDKGISIILGSSESPVIQSYWQAAKKRLEAGEKVADAMKGDVLERAEILIIGAHKNSIQLADSLYSISKRRDDLATRANKRFGQLAFFAAMAYSSISVLIALSASYLQYQAMMSSMMNTGG